MTLDAAAPLIADHLIASSLETSLLPPIEAYDAMSTDELEEQAGFIVSAIRDGSIDQAEGRVRVQRILTLQSELTQQNRTSERARRAPAQFETPIQFELQSEETTPGIGDRFRIILTFGVQEDAPFDSPAALFLANFDLVFDEQILRPLPDSLSTSDGLIVFPSGAKFENGIVRDFGVTVESLDRDQAFEIDQSDESIELASLEFEVVGRGNTLVSLQPTARSETVLMFGFDEAVDEALLSLSPLPIEVSVLNDIREAESTFTPTLFEPNSFATPSIFLSLEARIDQAVAPRNRELTQSRFPFGRNAVFGVPETEERENEESGEFNPSEASDRKTKPSTKANDSSAEGAELESSSDWSDLDLSLLDSEFALSLLELHFRTLQIVLDPDSEHHPLPSTQNAKVIDFGLADVTVWLTNPDFQAKSEDDDRSSKADASGEDKSLEQPSWSPLGRIVAPTRIEIIESAPATDSKASE
ncbi:MAG: hypothetical protein AAF802_03350 [Planctomycetota bacterium]